MLIKQLSIFIENKKGHLASITKVICDAGIDIRAISVFDSSEFGILRLVIMKTSDQEKAIEVLKNSGVIVLPKEDVYQVD